MFSKRKKFASFLRLNLNNYIASKWSKIVGLLPRPIKKLLLISFDFFGLLFSYVCAVQLVLGVTFDPFVLLVGAFYILVSFLMGNLFRVYRSIIRFSGAHLLKLLAAAQAAAIALVFGTSIVASISFPETFYVLLYFFSVTALGGGRLVARDLSYKSRRSGRRILIYGAGSAGIQLLTSLRQDWSYEVLAFIDDQKSLHGKAIHGLRVLDSSGLRRVISELDIDMIALAIPAASRMQFRNVLDKIDGLGIRVTTVPKISDILDGTSSIGNLKEVELEELLGREPVAPSEALLSLNITDKVVLVTGAGGSIGSELCRQIITGSPSKLILVENSELALYSIHQELEPEWASLIMPILGSVTDYELMRKIMEKEGVDTVYHAAAYKHVPLVEFNPFAGIQNNVFGTQRVLQAASEAGVSSFTLISTDKAVRPTNIMGASKRLAEILCQLGSEYGRTSMRIGMVRFGNVLGSSGSVIPKFKAQIKMGGPITVTHPEVTRYFMLIPEAVQLVLQASSMADSGEVFLLDMGEPVKIAELAKRLVNLSGHVLDEVNEPLQGKIAIEYTGLRPGEKLYEELLISGDIEDTEHKRIKKVKEYFPREEAFIKYLSDLHEICENQDERALRALLSNGGIGYGDEQAEKGGGGVAAQAGSIPSEPPIEAEDSGLVVATDLIGATKTEVPSKGVTVQSHRRSKYIFLERILQKVLHKYFLFSRPLTLGVRCVIFNDRHKVLLVKHTYISGWHLPGGGLSAGESAEACIAREIQEETGLELGNSAELIGVFHNQNATKRDHVVLFTASTSSDALPISKTFEIKSSEFFSLEDLPSDLDMASREWIVAALQSNHSNALI